MTMALETLPNMFHLRPIILFQVLLMQPLWS